MYGLGWCLNFFFLLFNLTCRQVVSWKLYMIASTAISAAATSTNIIFIHMPAIYTSNYPNQLSIQSTIHLYFVGILVLSFSKKKKNSYFVKYFSTTSSILSYFFCYIWPSSLLVDFSLSCQVFFFNLRRMTNP